MLLGFYTEYRWIIDMALATIIGAIVGTERELRGKSAGVRTYALVCLSSYLFSFLSIHAPGTNDSMRVAAQIIPGVGFIGAGVIWRKESASIEGLTTAASLLQIAAVGMAIGFGYMKIAVVSMAFALGVMETFGILVHRLKRNKIEVDIESKK